MVLIWVLYFPSRSRDIKPQQTNMEESAHSCRDTVDGVCSSCILFLFFPPLFADLRPPDPHSRWLLLQLIGMAASLSFPDYTSCAGHGLITIIGAALTTVHYGRGSGIYTLPVMASDMSLLLLLHSQQSFRCDENDVTWRNRLQEGSEMSSSLTQRRRRRRLL